MSFVRKSLSVWIAAVCWVSSTAGAAVWQEPAAPQAPGDAEAIKRGRTVYLENCVACHGQDATGGPMGEKTDLTRSEVVSKDVAGKQLGEFIAEGRPEAQMPPIALEAAQVKDLAAYLHSISALKPKPGDKPAQP